MLKHQQNANNKAFLWKRDIQYGIAWINLIQGESGFITTLTLCYLPSLMTSDLQKQTNTNLMPLYQSVTKPWKRHEGSYYRWGTEENKYPFLPNSKVITLLPTPKGQLIEEAKCFMV